MLVEWVAIGKGQGDSVVGLLPVPFLWLPNLEALLGAYEIMGDRPQARLDIAQAILDLHERCDRPSTFGVPLEEISQEERQRLFDGGAIAALNRFDPPPTDSNDKSPDPAPPWSSGNYQDDYLADLMFSLQSYSEAERLLKSRSLASVSNILRRLQDLHKGPEQREKQQLKDWFWDEYADEVDIFDL